MTIAPAVGFMAMIGAMMFGVLVTSIAAGLMARRDGKGGRR